jgi:argininosuccinate lyase
VCFRDYQQLKELIFPAFPMVRESLEAMVLMLKHIRVNPDILSDSKYDYLFTVEAVNKLVMNGEPFRSAYQQVGKQVETGKFEPEKEVNHTHLGSIGNPAFDQIEALWDKNGIAIEQVKSAYDRLLKEI